MEVLKRLVAKIGRTVIKVDRKANRNSIGLSVWQILQHGRVMGLLDARSMVMEEIKNSAGDLEATTEPLPIDWQPTIVRRGREVALVFDTLEEAFAAFELLANFDPNKGKA